jgi:protein FrlC
MPIKLSTATSVFVNYSLQDAVDHIIRAGFEGVDLWGGRPHLFRQDYSPGQIREVRRRLEDAGVAVVSLMPAFFRYPFSLSSPNDVIRQDSVDYVRACIDNAWQVGASNVLIYPTRGLHGQPVEDARARFYDSLTRLCPLAQAAGLTLGVEIVYADLSDYMSSSADALAAFRALGHPCLRAILDTGHLNLTGEGIEHALAALGPAVAQVHVNDNDGRQQQNAIPGAGTFDFSRLAAQLEHGQYDGYLTIELGWNYSFDPYPAVCEALQRMRGYLKGA